MLIMPYTREQFIAEVDRRCDRDTGLGAIWDAELRYRAQRAAWGEFTASLNHRAEIALKHGQRSANNRIVRKVLLPQAKAEGIYSETVKARAPELWQRSRVSSTTVHLRGPATESLVLTPLHDVFADLERRAEWRKDAGAKHEQRREAVIALAAELGIEGVWATDDGWVFGTAVSTQFNATRFIEIVGEAKAQRFITPRPERLGPIPEQKGYYIVADAPFDPEGDLEPFEGD